MDQAVTRSWRILALGGVAAVIFGIVALVWPRITVVALVALFGAYALIAGVLMLVSGLDLATGRVQHWVPMVLSGVAGIAIGIFTFFRPGVTALALILLIAVWAILTGIFEFAAGIELAGLMKGAWALWVGGLLSVAFGVLVALRPGDGALALVWLIGIYAIVLGITRLVFAYQVRSNQGAIKSAVRTLQPATR